ncbi:type I-E CRISPR-associated protein Cas7/Cse4/CasC [Streptodolium elevatio]
MSRTIVDVHILQTVPPSNLNRDDTGSPKTAVYGGVRRARVSSQAWKRATRTAFGDLLAADELGVRTRRVAEALADHILERDPSLKDTDLLVPAAEVIQVATGSKVEIPKRGKSKDGESEAAPQSLYLMFLSGRQLGGLAELAIEGLKSVDGITEFLKNKGTKSRARALANSRHSVDIALFGRMVADTSDINVGAAAQVAHAIGVHASDTESDYYTAVDDRNTDAETGAGMIGTVDFNSATLYRYAALDVDLLHKNLGAGLRDDEAPTVPVRRAVEAFVEGFVASMPTGKINTFGNHTLPDVVVVKVRGARPVSYAGAFERPVQKDEFGGYVANACTALAAHVEGIEKAYGVREGDAAWVLRVGPGTESVAGLGTEVSLAELVQAVGSAVADRLEPRE